MLFTGGSLAHIRRCIRGMAVPFLFLLLTALGCERRTSEKPAGPGPLRRLTLALNWVAEPEFGGFYAARESGDYRERGIAVEFLGGSTRLPVLQMVASGQVDLGIVEGDELLIGRAHGLDIVPIFAVFQNNPKAIMTHASRGAKELKDILTSGTLALYSGMTITTFLKKRFGWQGVQVVHHDGGIARFLPDKMYSQVCFATAEPLQAKAAGTETTTFLISDYGFNPYSGVIAVQKKRFDQSPDLFRAFIKASRKGWERYLADPAAANAIMAKQNTAMAPSFFATVAAAQKPYIATAEVAERGIGTMTRERWDKVARQLVELGVVEQSAKVDEFLLPID